MTKKGIVGHEQAKFNGITTKVAKDLIRIILKEEDVLVSGGCHLSGIDIWAEEIAREVCREEPIIHYPAALRWSGGYKERNIKIADDSEEIHCIVVEQYPEHYEGMKFSYCYHCKTSDHIKSGGCWTAKRVEKATWYIINPEGKVKVVEG